MLGVSPQDGLDAQFIGGSNAKKTKSNGNAVFSREGHMSSRVEENLTEFHIANCVNPSFLTNFIAYLHDGFVYFIYGLLYLL